MSLPSSGAISVGMLNYEIFEGGAVDESDVRTNNDVCDNDFVDLSATFSALADNSGEGSGGTPQADGDSRAAKSAVGPAAAGHALADPPRRRQSPGDELVEWSLARGP